ncbi:hypothetical protein [Amycolatopsis cihanbeyliensis]
MVWARALSWSTYSPFHGRPSNFSRSIASGSHSGASSAGSASVVVGSPLGVVSLGGGVVCWATLVDGSESGGGDADSSPLHPASSRRPANTATITRVIRKLPTSVTVATAVNGRDGL